MWRRRVAAHGGDGDGLAVGFPRPLPLSPFGGGGGGWVRGWGDTREATSLNQAAPTKRLNHAAPTKRVSQAEGQTSAPPVRRPAGPTRQAPGRTDPSGALPDPLKPPAGAVSWPKAREGG
ncbi:hypothetical protein JCM4914_30530 [Streptomyces platensis subsp. malvinus]